MTDSHPALRQHSPSAERNREPILAVLRACCRPPASCWRSRAARASTRSASPGRCRARLATERSRCRCACVDCRVDRAHGWRTCARRSRSTCIRPTGASSALDCRRLHQHDSHLAVERGASAFRGASRRLVDGGVLYLYGPYKRNGAHTAPSNEAFDQQLRAAIPRGACATWKRSWRSAASVGFVCDEPIAMPANNFSLVFRKRGGDRSDRRHKAHRRAHRTATQWKARSLRVRRSERQAGISFMLSPSTSAPTFFPARRHDIFRTLENSHEQTGNRRGGPRRHGPQSGAEHREPRPRGLGLQPQPREDRRTDRRTSGQEARAGLHARRIRRVAGKAAPHSADGEGGRAGTDATIDVAAAAAGQGRHSDRRRQHAFHRHHPPQSGPREVGPAFHRHGRVGRRGRRAERPVDHAGRPARSLRPRRADPHRDRREGAGRRAVRRVHGSGRRGPLREDGAQRHRIRRHAADRRELRRAEARRRVCRTKSWARSMPSGTRASSTAT